MDYGKFTFDELKKGYHYDEATKAHICNYCERAFSNGQVFTIDGAQYVADHAVEMHIESEHGGNMQQLLHSDTKYNTLNDNQKELLALFAAKTPDKDIAKQLGISASTVRHQKFTFREKAKQAKLYLAIFEHAFDGQTISGEETIVPIHNNATYYDDRYVITEQEKARILKTAFTSLEPPILKIFPAKEKKKVVILTKIAEQFTLGKQYTEKEVNELIKAVYYDYGTIRRYLIMYGFLERTEDGSRYWLTT